MSNNDSSEPSVDNDPHKPFVSHAGYYTTFPEHTQVAMAAQHPPPMPLTQLKNQSAFIQCPHCLDHVYTKISSAGPSELISIFALVYFLLPLDVSDLGDCLIAACVWLVYCFMYTHHACPSCHKGIATYNALKRVIGITAPAIATTTATATATSSGPPPLYSS
ncbi:hypothetical protein V8B55DRAFT_1583656 [Mucor lusitanicus]|uniref:LITAF domain-containing protein n=2 Tax=Mucor circinelloides f. lusitanicus TaxID=29924 RepID=A0A168JCJ4_MUCCL|nr:hypothetical protein FB192DRAFT_1357029 [Mucor lusitanicus]OAD01024.1 hypothetical protein MUCCIDRAFT_164932 [Mucor lusitanicus CBS 277.49]